MSTVALPDPSSSGGRRVVPLRLVEPREIRLVVLMPALNEERTVGDAVRRVPRQIDGIDAVHIVVIDDGSSDQTGSEAKLAGATVVRHASPGGVGAAFQTGLRKAFQLGADYVVTIDADGQFNPEEIPRLIAPVLAGEADFSTASRFLDAELEPEMPPAKRWGNRQVSRLISRLTGIRIHDCTCGMRAYNHEAAFCLGAFERFTYTHEVLLHLAAKRMSIVEVPMRIRGVRQYGKSRVAKSVLWYGAHTLKIIFRFYRDYSPLRFFGAIAGLCLLAGLPFAGFFALHYWTTGSFSPHKWSAVVAGVCCLCAVGAGFMGLLGDMLNRQRFHLEEILYHSRSLIAAENRR